MTTGRAWVLDASALLALLFDEPGGELVARAAAGRSVTWRRSRSRCERGLTASVVSAVNLSEVMHKLLERSVELDSLRDDLEALGVGVAIFDGGAAEEAANLRLATRAAGLSLGDRACLALARQLDLPAVTADRTVGRSGGRPRRGRRHPLTSPPARFARLLAVIGSPVEPGEIGCALPTAPVPPPLAVGQKPPQPAHRFGGAPGTVPA